MDQATGNTLSGGTGMATSGHADAVALSVTPSFAASVTQHLGPAPYTPAESSTDGLVAATARPTATCGTCHADLGRLPTTAHFCPRCGAPRFEPDLADLVGPLDTSATSDASNASEHEVLPVLPLDDAEACVDEWLEAEAADRRVAEWNRLRAAFDANQPSPAKEAQPVAGASPPVATSFVPAFRTAAGAASLVLIGYANAMFRLGRRYERGHGVSRNPGEAVRCYTKAARLGNVAALDRLAPQCVAPAAMVASHA